MGTKRTGLGDVLFSRTQQRVLSLFFGSPERSFYANEVVRLAKVGIGSVQRELERMAAVSLITSEKVGNQKHYRANRSCPIFDELRGIVLKTFGLADVVRGALEPLRERIEVAFIYGSIARGSDKTSSDIDLMIVSDRLAYPDVLEILEGSEQRFGRQVNPTVYKLAEFRRKLTEDNGFVRRVLEQPRLNLIGSADDLAEPRKPRKVR